MRRLPRVLHIISRPTEPDTSNCIVSAGTDYKVTATAPSYKWHRDKMGGGGGDVGMWGSADAEGVDFSKCRLHIFCGSD